MGSPKYFTYLKNNSEARQFHHGKPTDGTEFARYIQERRNKHHIYKIHVSDDHPTTSSNLIMLGHRPDHIAFSIKKFLTFPSRKFKMAEFNREYRYGPHALTQSQRLGIKEYFELHGKPGKNPEDVNVLEKYYNAFNKIFFFSALKNMCTIRLAPPLVDIAGQCTSHITTARSLIPENSACLIEIMDLKSSTRNLSDEDRLFDYVETLLHEMLHAFFEIYSCDCRVCESNYFRLIGPDGHRSAWQSAARTIEHATKRLLGTSLSMARRRSLAHDVSMFEQSGGKLVDPEAWSILHFDVAEQEEGDDFDVDEEDEEYEFDTEDEESEEDGDDEIYTDYEKGSKRMKAWTQRETGGCKRARRSEF